MGVPTRQAISHAHFHIAGTFKSVGTEFGEVEEKSVEETGEIAKKLLGGP
jgi:hypothetical protein